jgi:hypothetical protein
LKLYASNLHCNSEIANDLGYVIYLFPFTLFLLSVYFLPFVLFLSFFLCPLPLPHLPLAIVGRVEVLVPATEVVVVVAPVVVEDFAHADRLVTVLLEILRDGSEIATNVPGKDEIFYKYVYREKYML